MTQLTTDELRQIVETDHVQCGDAAAMARELLANREAQSVACDIERIKRHALPAGECPKQSQVVLLSSLLRLFTAPPAPAVPEGYCIMPLTLTAANGAKGALSGEFKVSRTVRCHECGGEGCDDCGDAGEFEEETTVPWDTIKEIYRAAVDACRAAMLDGTSIDEGTKYQPVSQGYKLVPVEPTEDMIAAAMNCDDVEFNSDETFCVNFDNIYRAMIAAAPEGGNG